MINSPIRTSAESVDFSGVEFVLVDYFGTQGKSWTIDEAKTVQDLLGHQFDAPEGQPSDGVDPKLRRLLDTTNVRDLAQFLHLVAGKLGTGPVTAKAIGLFHEMRQRVMCCAGEFKDTAPGLECLKRKGYRIGVMSNLSPFDVDYIFHNHDQFHRNFEVLVFSYEVGHVKPEAEMFVKAGEQVGLPLDKILLIDDEVENVKAAKRLGMKAVLIDRWGKVKETIPGVPKIRLLTDLADLLPQRK